MCVCACFNISECIVVVECYCCVFVTSANAKQSMDEWMDGHCSLSHSPMTFKADRGLHLSSRTQKANIHILHQKKSHNSFSVPFLNLFLTPRIKQAYFLLLSL